MDFDYILNLNYWKGMYKIELCDESDEETMSVAHLRSYK